MDLNMILGTSSQTPLLTKESLEGVGMQFVRILYHSPL